MNLCSLPFAALVILGLSLFYTFRQARQRATVLLLLNCVFLSAQVTTFKALWPLAIYLGVALLAIRLVNRYRSRALFIGAVVILLAGFLYLKRYAFAAFLPQLPPVFVAIGLSYIVFRVLHVLVDTYLEDRPRDDLATISLLNYFTSFLTLTSGPIQRYEDHHRQELALGQAPAWTAAIVHGVLTRLATGYLKLVFIGPLLLDLHNHLVDALPQHPLAFTGAGACWILFIYANFAGYMDIVIGLGRLFGFELPENFDAPLLCTSFLDLWSRWHVTLSNWFRDYVFIPLVRALCLGSDRPALLPYFGVLAYFIVFFLLGVWHGSDVRYVVLGLFFGLGASANKLFEVEMTRRLGLERYQALRERTWYQALARALALTCFAFAESVIWAKLTDFGAFQRVIADLGPWGVAANVAACVGAILALQVAALAALACWRRAAAALGPLMAGWSGAPLALGLRVLLLVVLLRGKAGAPEPQREPAQAANAPTRASEAFYGRF